MRLTEKEIREGMFDNLCRKFVKINGREPIHYHEEQYIYKQAAEYAKLQVASGKDIIERNW